jgi:hypothetical protein
VPDAMFFEDKEKKVQLYVWHKATDPGDLYGTTQRLIEQQATFMTFGEACQKELVKSFG